MRFAALLSLVLLLVPSTLASAAPLQLQASAAPMPAEKGAQATVAVCSLPAVDLRISYENAEVFGEDCKPILRRENKDPIKVAFDLERVDPSVWASDVPNTWHLKSWKLNGLGLNNVDVPHAATDFSYDVNAILPDMYFEPYEKHTLTLSTINIDFVFARYDSNGTYLGDANLSKQADITIPFTLYKQIATYVEIDGYLRKLTVTANDVVIEGSNVRLAPRSGVRVTPIEPHVAINPEQQTTDANGMAVFTLYPYPPTDLEGPSYVGSFSFDTDIFDKIRPQNAAVYFGKTPSLSGNVTGTERGDIVGAGQTVTLGHSQDTASGAKVYPSVQLELNDRTLVKIASQNDAVEGSTLHLTSSPGERYQMQINVNGAPTGEEGQTWFEWGLQRAVVGGLLLYAPWSGVVRFATGQVINFILDRTLYSKSVFGAIGSLASPERPYGAFKLSGMYLANGDFTIDNAYGGTPIEIQLASGTTVLGPATRMTVNATTGAATTGTLPTVCGFAHNIDIEPPYGETLTTLASRNPELRVKHTPCNYLEDTLMVWIDGVPAQFDINPIGGYTYILLKPASYLTPGTHVVKARILDQDGQQREATRTVVVQDSAGITVNLPEGVAALAGRAAVAVRWQAGDPAVVAGYNVYRKVGDTPAVRLTSQPQPQPLFFDAALPVGATGVYTVTAVSSTGYESPGSAVVSASLLPTATLAAPAVIISPTVAAGELITVAWNSAAAPGWLVERGTSAAGPFTAPAGLVPTVTRTSFRDTSAAPGTAYWYRVTSIGLDGAPGTPAVIGPVTAVNAPPAAPTGVRGFNQDNQATITWQPPASSDVQGYYLYVAGPNSSYVRVNSTPVAATSLSALIAPDALPNWYRVTAVDTAGNESAPSEAVLVSYAPQQQRVYIPVSPKGT